MQLPVLPPPQGRQSSRRHCHHRVGYHVVAARNRTMAVQLTDNRELNHNTQAPRLTLGCFCVWTRDTCVLYPQPRAMTGVVMAVCDGAMEREVHCTKEGGALSDTPHRRFTELPGSIPCRGML